MESVIEKIGALLLIATFVAMLARRLDFPYTVGLLLAGLGIALLPFIPTLALTKDLIFLGLLPPLIFEASLFLPWKELKKVMPPVLLIASVGLILSAIVTGLGMYWIMGWPPIAAAIFGVLIAATDPVSVIATFKEAGVKGTLRMLVESESLFNDGVAAVLFTVVLVFANGAAITAPEIILKTLYIVGGGIGAGLLVGALVLGCIRQTEDHLVELMFTTFAAYGSFMLAEHLHTSGVLATLTTGLLVGNLGHLGRLTEKGREVVESFWDFAAFIANSLIFILIGIYLNKHASIDLWLACAVAIALVMTGRVFAIYPLAALFKKSRFAISTPHQHIMVWGGLRGALGLALALGLPETTPYYDQIITVTFAVVGFSVLVQGLTMVPVLVHLGLLPKKQHRKTTVHKGHH
jgi:monovalent cation:H+ antiporter, CPA1 family